MSKSFKKFIAVVSAIAMVVTSLTVYNAKTASAADYSGLTYVDITNNSNSEFASSLKGSKIAVESGKISFNAKLYQNVGFNELYLAVAGISEVNLVVTINGQSVETEGTGVHMYNAANYLTYEYNVLSITSDGGSGVAIIYCPGNAGKGTYGDSSDETTTVDPDAPTTTPAPTTTTTTAASPLSTYEWSPIECTSLSYAAQATITSKVGKKSQVATVGSCPIDHVRAEDNGISILAGSYGKAIRIYLNGTQKFENTGNSAVGTTIPYTDLQTGYNDITVVFVNANNELVEYRYVVNITDEAVETTTKAYVDGEVLVNDSKTVEVPAYEGGDYWQNEFNNAPVTYVAGKKYVAEVVVSSTAAKTIKLVFQRVKIWDFVDAAKGYEATIQAGNKVKITYVFEATQGTDNGNFDIYLGSVAEATTLVFESKKLTTYNVVPEGVVTGVEVLSAPEETTEAPEETTEATTEYGITVDGVEVTKVESGNTYTLPTEATYGYYDGTNMYKAGATVTVNADMAFTSVNELSVSVEQGAGIRVDGTAGIRFQATATTDNEAALDSDAIKEGMLITANDLYQNFGELTTDCAYTKLTIKNSGWYDKDGDGETYTPEVGKYCGSIVNIVEPNYIRKFIARAYLTITYEDGTSTTVYSGMTGARSIAGVAQAVATAGYPGLTAEQQALVDVYAAAK